MVERCIRYCAAFSWPVNIYEFSAELPAAASANDSHIASRRRTAEIYSLFLCTYKDGVRNTDQMIDWDCAGTNYTWAAM